MLYCKRGFVVQQKTIARRGCLKPIEFAVLILLFISYRGAKHSKLHFVKEYNMNLQGKFAVLLFVVLCFFMLSVLDLDLVQAEDPTPEEQLFIFELNRARNNPAQFQTENSLSVDLSAVAAQPPLAVNGDLTGSAGFKAQEMADNNYFTHESPISGWPNALARSFGYNLASSLGDNINNIESIAAGFDSVIDWTQPLPPLLLLIVDDGVPSLGHRKHLLAMDSFNQRFREIGVGYGSNSSSSFKNYWAVHTGFDDDEEPFLTGVVYNDANVNNRYDLNEGLSGVTVSVGGISTTTNSAGGWSILTSSGCKTAQCSGGPFVGTSTAYFIVGSDNVEVDFISGNSSGVVNFGSVGATVPVLDIKANGSDGPVTPIDDLSITVALDSGCRASVADWWVIVYTPSGEWEHLTPTGFTPGLSPTLQGFPLIDFGSTEIFNTSGLGAGTYTYYFAVDLGGGELYFDWVVVTVDPSPQITANSSGGTVNINEGDPLSIAISLSSGSFSGESADWWIIVNTPSGWQYYDFNLGDYTTGLMPSISGFSLLDFGSNVIFNKSSLGAGTYTYYFAVDLGGGQLFFKSVVVKITTP